MTKETVDAFVRDNNIGIGITQIITDAGIKTDHTKIPVDHFQYPLSKNIQYSQMLIMDSMEYKKLVSQVVVLDMELVVLVMKYISMHSY